MYVVAAIFGEYNLPRLVFGKSDIVQPHNFQRQAEETPIFGHQTVPYVTEYLGLKPLPLRGQARLPPKGLPKDPLVFGVPAVDGSFHVGVHFRQGHPVCNSQLEVLGLVSHTDL